MNGVVMMKRNKPIINFDEYLDLAYEECDLLEVLDDDFERQIKSRGREYFDIGNVQKVIKSESKSKITYIAKVLGSSDKPYTVNIEINEDGIEYSCNCPCDFPCKHEYAVLLAIDNLEYEMKNLKPIIYEKKESIEKTIKKIPAEKLKRYLLNNDCSFAYTDYFEKKFFRYFSKQKYEFYYNNLYNSFLINDGYVEFINCCFDTIKKYITVNDFNEVFKIIKSIINAYGENQNIYIDEYFDDLFSSIGMFLRISYRKANKSLKEQIITWMNELDNKDYYNNLYLEDIILSVKNIDKE